MANPNIPLYNFFKRYKWTENDFAGWQDGMVSLGRGVFEGLFNGAVMLGYTPSSSGGLTLQVASGIAVGPSGYLHVSPSGNFLLSAPGAGLAKRSLIVATPLLVNSAPMTRPTTPFDTVFLKTLQQSQLTLIDGAASASPVNPAIGANDVVVASVLMRNGMTTIDVTSDLDMERKDIYGRNSDFQQNFGKYDDRVRPYRVAGTQLLGIKPSQLTLPTRPMAFSFTSRTNPSIFPKAAGLYNGAAGDTFIDFKTGLISGADTTSSAFAPTIPAAGSWIVSTVSLKNDDTLQFGFGTAGTRAQCFAGIQSQKSVGAGSISIPNGVKLLAYVLILSVDGVNVTAIDVIDCRGVAATGTSTGFGGLNTELLTGPTTRTVVPADDGKIFLCDNTLGSVQIQLSNPNTTVKFNAKDVSLGIQIQMNPLKILQFGSEKINNIAAAISLTAPGGSWEFIPDGTNWWGL